MVISSSIITSFLGAVRNKTASLSTLETEYIATGSPSMDETNAIGI